jgi:tetratricopeptide (TPR) repeat protein
MLRAAARLIGLAVALLAGPAGAEAPSGGWTEVQTSHVTVKTDLGAADARRAAQMAERLRSAMLAAAWPGAKLIQPERTQLVVLASHMDFVRYFGDSVSGALAEEGYPPTVFLFGPPEKWESRETLELAETNSLLKQALAAHLAAFVYQRQPRWFRVGLAQFLETLRLSEDGKTATLGDINLQAVREYNSHRTVTVEDALGWGTTLNPSDEATLSGLYGLSWLMVHWMYNTHPAEFARFQSLLSKGVDPEKAWKVAFPGVSTGELDRELNHFVHYGDYRNASVTVPEVDVRVTVQPMAPADVHATRAAMALAADKSAEAATELKAALAADPTNVAALRLRLAQGTPQERTVLGRRATAAHPGDGLAWLTLAEALPEDTDTWEERAEAYRKATELLPDHPAAFNALAWMDFRKGKFTEALPLAVAAVRMAPWDSAILNTLAATLAMVGRCSEALPTQGRALDMLSDGATSEQRDQYVTRLATMKRRCSELATAAPPAAVPALNEAPAPIPLPPAKP